jgi:hypothetical protein
MSRVCVAFEKDVSERASHILSLIDSSLHTVEIIERDRFPIADSLVYFILKLMKFDTTFALLTDEKENSYWFLRELKSQSVVEHNFNIIPILIGNVDFPQSYPSDKLPYYRIEEISQDIIISSLARRCSVLQG